MDAICNRNVSQYALDAKRLGLPADCHMPLQCQHTYSTALSGGGLAGAFSPAELDLLINTCLPEDSLLYQEDDATVFKAEHQPENIKTSLQKSHRRSLRQAYPGSNFKQNSAINGDTLNLTSIFQGQDINLLQEKHQTLAAPLWNLDRIDQRHLPLDKTYSFGSAESPGVGQGVTIYVLDTGIMSNHQEFQTWSSFGGNNNNSSAAAVSATSAPNNDPSTPSTSRASCGRDFVKGSAHCEDIDGHGSHVAGTAIGLQVGVAKGASVIAVKILDDQGLGTVGSTIAGLDYVASTHKNPAVVTLSLGVQRGLYSRAMEDAVRALVEDHGVMVIAAAGNGASDSCQFSPGATPHAFTVGASGFAGTFSNLVDNTNNEESSINAIKAVEHGGVEGVYTQGNQGKCVDLFAPGTDIYSICGGIRRCGHVRPTTYAYASGTSMAVPHVAGAAAIYLESHPEASPAEVVEAMKGAAVEGAISPRVLRAETANMLLQVKGLGGNHGESAAVQAADGPTASTIGKR